MSRRHQSLAAGLAVSATLALSLAVACTDRQLVPVEGEQPKVVDDLIDIDAEFCTRPVSDVTFPVKLILVVDTSGSLQFTDQSGLRRVAIRQLMSNLATQNDLLVTTIGFGSNINTDPPIAPDAPIYVPASQWAEPPFIGLADVQTNYHGAIDAVKATLLNDLLTSDPAEIARTKYVIIFFSDGSPSPKCCISADEQCFSAGTDPQAPNADCSSLTPFQSVTGAQFIMPYGCEPEPFETIQAGIRYCEGEPEQTICNDEEFLERFRDVNPADVPPDFGDGTLAALDALEANDNYNRTYQLEDLVTDVMELGEEFGVGEMRFHTALLFDSTLDDSVKAIFRLNRCRSERLLQRMAELGNGIYRDFENGEEIDFLSFNFTSLKQSFTLLRAYAQNTSALPPPVQGNVAREVQVFDFRPDTDGDGVDDDEELTLGTDVADRDSDKLATQPSINAPPPVLSENPADWGDGWSDLFETSRLDIGFDPRFQNLPVDACADFAIDGRDRQDLDADGLNGCEENLLGTDPKRADSDGDGFTDGVEFRFGTNPVFAEGNRDDDFDGVPNADEIQRGTNPKLPDLALKERAGTRYELVNTGTTTDGRTCYKATARGVHLASTQPRITGFSGEQQTSRSGYNEVLFWLAEAPSDAASRVEMRVACHRSQYQAPSLKNPANGKVTFTEADFIDLAKPEDLQRILDGEDICTGLEVR